MSMNDFSQTIGKRFSASFAAVLRQRLADLTTREKWKVRAAKRYRNFKEARRGCTADRIEMIGRAASWDVLDVERENQ